ncbi:MAG: hypothetical protein JSS62_05500 [Verrucomicrobia bacterium]|nr:hypothetical protein [Verrucomicrobiota bacterium]MBS0646356.1 hypothetical protein [Verrucomicrobiota bacterium]
MKKICTLIVAILVSSGVAHCAKMQGPVRKEEAPLQLGPKIRVLLAKEVNSALVEAKGTYRVIERTTQDVISSGLVGKRYILHAIKEGLRWGEEFPGYHHITLVPSNRQTVFYVNGFQYKGVVDVYLEANQQITIVNEVPIEDYVRSTVALQLKESLSKEALSAYVIAARTEAYAIALTGQASEGAWDVRAKDVGYFGNGVVLQGYGVDEGVEATRFMVLESTKARLPEHVRVMPEKLKEMADAGYDAKQILHKCFPNTRLNVTADPNARVVR